MILFLIFFTSFQLVFAQHEWVGPYNDFSFIYSCKKNPPECINKVTNGDFKNDLSILQAKIGQCRDQDFQRDSKNNDYCRCMDKAFNNPSGGIISDIQKFTRDVYPKVKDQKSKQNIKDFYDLINLSKKHLINSRSTSDLVHQEITERNKKLYKEKDGVKLNEYVQKCHHHLDGLENPKERHFMLSTSCNGQYQATPYGSVPGEFLSDLNKVQQRINPRSIDKMFNNVQQTALYNIFLIWLWKSTSMEPRETT